MKSASPSLQLFILCHDRPDFAGQAIRSALAQTQRRFEIVISDNSTSDSVQELVQSEFPSLEYRRRSKDLNAFDHFNQCLSEASADYVCLFHDDDLLGPRFMEQILGAAARYPDAVAIGVNAWAAEEGKPSRPFFNTIGAAQVVSSPRQLATHYFSRHQLGFAPFPGYVYSRARIQGMRFETEGGKYADVTWLLGVAARGTIVWIAEPLMTYRLHAGNDGRRESLGDRLKLLAYFKKQVSTLGAGLLMDLRFFVYKKALDLNDSGVLAIPPARKKRVLAYLTKYRVLRFARLDHHKSFLRKAKFRLVQQLRPGASRSPHGVA
jgi:glycosyltransferase involved in cell wall biosynthesis